MKKEKNFDLTLYLVTDSKGHSEESFLHTIEEACKGGVTLVQLREKEAGGKEYLEKAEKVKKITDRYGIPLIIDDRVDVAIACDAAGVHVGAEDLPVARVRSLLGPDKILGATAKTVETARRALEDGADYLGVGAIYPSATKEGALRTPIERVGEICRRGGLPVTAIGGLNLENLEILRDCPVQGISVVSALMGAENPRQAAERLREKLTDLKIPAVEQKVLSGSGRA